MSTQEECKKAANQFSFNEDGLIHDEYTTDNQSEKIKINNREFKCRVFENSS